MRWHVRQHSTSKILFLSLTYSRTSRSQAWGCWYVSNVSITFDCSMLLYYQSWMFYNYFISFLVLTYWHSAKCQLLFSACFLHRRKSIPNGVRMQRNFTENFYGPEGTQLALTAPGGCPEGGTTHQGAQEAQARPGGLCPPRGTPRRSQGPLRSFWSKKNLREVSLHLESVWY